MLSLNRDILFAVGKKIVEDGDSDAVYKFALSGRRHLAILSHVFASITTLKLSKNSYAIGWGDKCCTYNFENEELPLKSLLHQAGNCIQTLHIEERIPIFRLYEPIIDKMIDNKQLISLSVGVSNDRHLIDALLTAFASTLKNVVTPMNCVSTRYHDALNLDSLTFLNHLGIRVSSFYGKTSSLTLTFDGYDPFRYYDNAYNSGYINPTLLPVKQLTFDGYSSTVFGASNRRNFVETINAFPSLDLIKYNIPMNTINDIHFYINSFTNIITKFKQVPTKLVFGFYKFKVIVQLIDIYECKKICDAFEFDESRPDMYCFRKIVQSADSKATILEVQVAKEICIPL